MPEQRLCVLIQACEQVQHMWTSAYFTVQNSAAGTATRVARVRAEHPNPLHYSRAFDTHTQAPRCLVEIAWPSRGNAKVLPLPTLPLDKQKTLWLSGEGAGLLGRWDLRAWVRIPRVPF
jgi:hypothetical protein